MNHDKTTNILSEILIVLGLVFIVSLIFVNVLFFNEFVRVFP